MASGSIVGDDGTREKQRYTESKVYTRKAFKGPKNKGNAVNTVPPAPSAAPTTATTTTVTTVDNNDNNSTVEDRNDVTKDNGNSVSVRVQMVEDRNSAQPVVNSTLDMVSDDSSSLNNRQNEPSSRNVGAHLSPGNGAANMVSENHVKISMTPRSKHEIQELKRKLESELERVRSLVNRIEEKQELVGGYGNSNMPVDTHHHHHHHHRVDNRVGYKRSNSEVASAGVPREPTRSLLRQLSVSVLENRDNHHRVDSRVGAKRSHSEVASASVPREPTRSLQRQLSISVLQNSPGIGENVEKEKRTPKANQFYHNSEFLLGKDKLPTAESNKKSKLNGKKHGGGGMRPGFGMGSKYFRSCSSLLEKLMKHKHGWVFNSPVDVEGLGLHDYFSIIKHPMDLGTVKSRLNKILYKSPKDFAEDVRLTFRNAMTYNPRGQDVHVMAEQLAELFEEKWAIIESNYDHELRYGIDYGASVPAPSPLSRKAPAYRPPSLDMKQILDRSESVTQHAKPMSFTPSARTPAPKKPKAKDPHKRDMTSEEKQKLSTNLQNLPSEKLDAVVQIIQKRNSSLSQHDDEIDEINEIEVDIDSVDVETLWELDRFVTNYKKSLSKRKRKAELAIQARARAEQAAHRKSQAPVMVEVQRKTQADERNVPPSLPVQGEVRVDNGGKTSSSSSSSSDSGSSSSDSDSDSSSASGSDAGSQRT